VLWLVFGGFVIAQATERWRTFTDCCGLRLATCLLAFLIYFGPPGLPYWQAPGVYIQAAQSVVPSWAARPALELIRFDSALNELLNDAVGRRHGITSVILFDWEYAMGSFAVTSVIYGLFIYAVACTCHEEEADAGDTNRTDLKSGEPTGEQNGTGLPCRGIKRDRESNGTGLNHN
jgi:hypothetical protein